MAVKTLREFRDLSERMFLLHKLEENNWNVTQTAQAIDTPAQQPLQEARPVRDPTREEPPRESLTTPSASSICACWRRAAPCAAATSCSPRASTPRPTCSAPCCSRTRCGPAGWARSSPSCCARFHPDSVLSPALGGVIIGHEVAAALGVPFRFTERKGEEMGLRRGFTLRQGERVVIVEDVVTTGRSTLETAALATGRGARVVAIGAIIDRTVGRDPFDVPFRALLPLDLPVLRRPPSARLPRGRRAAREAGQPAGAGGGGDDGGYGSGAVAPQIPEARQCLAESRRTAAARCSRLPGDEGSAASHGRGPAGFAGGPFLPARRRGADPAGR